MVIEIIQSQKVRRKLYSLSGYKIVSICPIAGPELERTRKDSEASPWMQDLR